MKTNLLVVSLVGIALLAGCTAESDDEEEGSTESAVSSKPGPCPVCTTKACAAPPVCPGIRKGTKGCVEGTTTKAVTEHLKPESVIYKTTCTAWGDGSGGEGWQYTRTCTQHSYRAILDTGVCTGIDKPAGQGPYPTQWIYTSSPSDLVKRSREEVQTDYIAPTETATGWSSWKKE